MVNKGSRKIHPTSTGVERLFTFNICHKTVHKRGINMTLINSAVDKLTIIYPLLYRRRFVIHVATYMVEDRKRRDSNRYRSEDES